MIPQIDIWRAAQLMLKRYGDKALEESATRADKLEADDSDHNGAAVWRLITAAVAQLAKQDPGRSSALIAIAEVSTPLKTTMSSETIGRFVTPCGG